VSGLLGLALYHQANQFRHLFIVAGAGTPGSKLVVQPGQPALLIAAPPVADRGRRDPAAARHFPIGVACGRAPDACQRCYAYRHGFRSSGRYLICRVCGNRCKLDKVTTGIASCAPVNLRYQSTGKTVQIQTSDLKGASSFF
jgi:Membrane iron-sulfur containing protein FtrD-like